MPKKEDRKNSNGITLVALVVTIVVLLILAGITLVYVFGDNGIIKLAQDEKEKTEQGMQNEQDEIGNLVNMLKEETGNSGNSSGGNKPQIGPDKKGEIQTADKTEYKDSKDSTMTAIIPGGFCVVKDSSTDTNTVESGLVISDIADDDLDNSKHGNQFVWIPVSDYSKFHLIEGYHNGSLLDMLSKATNPSREAGDTLKAGSPGKPNAANSVAGTAESRVMYKSVKDNGGFYIARFEAGVAGTTDNDNLSTKTATDGTVKPLSQKGVGVWNKIPWGGTSSNTASDGLQGDDNANGAVMVARSMYQKDGKPDGIHKVTSTLCYGVQWDAALKFIEPNYGEYNEAKTDYQVATDSYVKTAIKDGVTRGNYTGSIATTGSKTAYQQKHIYDMAGNVYEWTMEAYSTDYRVDRGGYYNSVESEVPASYRSYDSPDNSYCGIGLRLALYL